jgi:acyl carrier protein
MFIMADYLTQDSISTRVEEIVKEHIGEDIDLSPQTLLEEDLSIDSLERIELGIKLEKAFGIKLANDQLRRSTTIEDFIQLVSSARQGSRA